MPDALMHDPVLYMILDRVRAAFHPHSVYLFGSRAAGTARSDSDYDLLMVLPDDYERKIHPFDLYEATRGLGVPVELFPCTRMGFDSGKDSIGNLSYEAYHHGQLVYSA